MPPSVAHSKARSQKKQPAVPGVKQRSWGGLKAKNLKDLAERIKKGFKWAHVPQDYQVEAVKAQLVRKDVLIHAGTGSGKTAVAAGPYALEETKGLVTLMVSPLIALQEEQVSQF